MLQIANMEEIGSNDIPQLLELIQPILDKRKALHEKYTRQASETQLMYTTTGNGNTIVPFEKFITDLATGYLSGKPVYSVTDTSDDEKRRLLNDLLDIPIKSEDYKKGMEIIIDYIASYNDDETENYDLIHDILELTACYELLYENEENEVVYSKLDPLQTVAVWDYEIPANLTGLVRTWFESDLNGSQKQVIEITDKNGTRRYDETGLLLEEPENHNWGDVPAFAVETDIAIFEKCEDIISAYEQLIQNIRNTYQYNDTDCKLKITNYQPENSAIIYDEQGNPTINPARTMEDNVWMNTKTIYVGEGGDVEWLLKQQDSDGATTILKTYVDLMFQLAGIPNTSDLAFNSTDLNASAIDRKFYVMNMATTEIVSELKKAYLRRWELIFNRINLKKNTDFDFRDIEIDLPKNLPNNDDEMVTTMLKLTNLLSEQTIIEKLGYNYIDEKNKKEAEAMDNILTNIEHMSAIGDGNNDVREMTDGFINGVPQEEDEEKTEE